MQHILQIAFDFDDDKVRSTAERAVENEMGEIIKGIVLDEIAPISSGWYGNKERDWNRLWHHIDNFIDKILADNRDEIIEKAADKLVKSAKNTKVWKSKFAEIISEVENG